MKRRGEGRGVIDNRMDSDPRWMTVGRGRGRTRVIDSEEGRYIG